MVGCLETAPQTNNSDHVFNLWQISPSFTEFTHNMQTRAAAETLVGCVVWACVTDCADTYFSAVCGWRSFVWNESLVFLLFITSSLHHMADFYIFVKPDVITGEPKKRDSFYLSFGFFLVCKIKRKIRFNAIKVFKWLFLSFLLHEVKWSLFSFSS